jgi:hypothetical protein
MLLEAPGRGDGFCFRMFVSMPEYGCFIVREFAVDEGKLHDRAPHSDTIAAYLLSSSVFEGFLHKVEPYWFPLLSSEFSIATK